VQGVGYRYFVQRQAIRRGLKGWVRNRPDGSVEALVEGEESSIEALLEDCRRGPALAEVEEVSVAWEEYTGEFSGFRIAF